LGNQLGQFDHCYLDRSRKERVSADAAPSSPAILSGVIVDFCLGQAVVQLVRRL